MDNLIIFPSIIYVWEESFQNHTISMSIILVVEYVKIFIK